MPSLRQCRLLGLRLGTNRKGLSWAVAARWAERRRAVYEAWLASGCNSAAAGRKLGVSRQCVHRTIRRYLDGLDLARAARVEEEERLALRRGRQAHRAKCRRRERAMAGPSLAAESCGDRPPRPTPLPTWWGWAF